MSEFFKAHQADSTDKAFRYISPAGEQFAKLLATENISVVHQNIPTPRFEWRTRTLALPFWKGLSRSQLDLILSHEVGHAKYTPGDEWQKAIKTRRLKEQEVYGMYLNVVEDARIERFIKHRFPGLVPVYYDGYSAFCREDFFGLSTRDTATMTLIDRLNVMAKVGLLHPMPFNAEERVIYRRMQSTQTFEDVVALTNEIFEREKPPLPKLVKVVVHGDEGDGDTSEESGDGQDVPDDSEFDETVHVSSKSKSQPKEGEQSKGEGESSQDKSESKSGADQNGSGGQNSEKSEAGNTVAPTLPPSPTTTGEFEKHLMSKVSKGAGYDTCEFPVYNSQMSVIEPREMMRWFDAAGIALTRPGRAYMCRLKAQTRPLVVSMVSMFERQKRAKDSFRALESTLGSLDARKISKHRITDQVFKKLTILPKGKSHGLVILLDWSSSMSGLIEPVLQQTYFVASFMRQLNIPFDVYAFTDNQEVRNLKQAPGTTHVTSGVMIKNAGRTFGYNRAHLLHLVSSTMVPREFEAMFDYLFAGMTGGGKFMVTGSNTTAVARARSAFSLGSTPLNEGILMVRDLLLNFMFDRRIDRRHFIIMTDGGGTTTLTTPKHAFSKENFHVILKDTVVGRTFRVQSIPGMPNDQQVTFFLMEWLSDTTKSDVTWMFLGKTPACFPGFDQIGLSSQEQKTLKSLETKGFCTLTQKAGTDFLSFIDPGMFKFPDVTSAPAKNDVAVVLDSLKTRKQLTGVLVEFAGYIG